MSTATTSPSEPRNIAGIWVYSQLPEGMRPASVLDLIHPDGRPRVGVWFILESFVHQNWYSAYQVRANFNLSKWLPWFSAGKLYVKS